MLKHPELVPPQASYGWASRYKRSHPSIARTAVGKPWSVAHAPTGSLLNFISRPPHVSAPSCVLLLGAYADPVHAIGTYWETIHAEFGASR